MAEQKGDGFHFHVDSDTSTAYMDYAIRVSFQIPDDMDADEVNTTVKDQLTAMALYSLEETIVEKDPDWVRMVLKKGTRIGYESCLDHMMDTLKEGKDEREDG